MTSFYTVREDVFQEQIRRAEELFRSARRLPEPVFQPGYRACLAVEFDQLMTRRFWHVVRAISAETGDPGVTWTVLDPHPDEYYRRHFGYFGVARLPASLSADGFLEVLAHEPPDSPADAMLYNARVVACHPDSAGWLVWGERELGIAMIPSARRRRPNRPTRGPSRGTWRPLPGCRPPRRRS